LILSSGEDSLSLDKFILSNETMFFLPISWNSLIQLNAVQGTSLVFSVVKTWRSAKFSESGGILVKANSIRGPTKLLEVFKPTLKHGNSGPPKPRAKNKRGENRIKIAKEIRTPPVEVLAGKSCAIDFTFARIVRVGVWSGDFVFVLYLKSL
jgi:hypothetical protein